MFKKKATNQQRRAFLQVGMIGGLGLTLGDFFRMQSAQAAQKYYESKEGKAKSVIHIFLPGGTAHQETWDPKPYAPVEYRGPLGSIKTKVSAHPGAAAAMAAGDRLFTFAEIAAQGIELDMPAVKTENPINDGDVITVGGLELEVWNTPGHTDSQLAFRMGNLLFSGDNIFRDGCVGAIDAHHGSNIEHFIESLERIKASDVEWLLPSHGPVFRNDSAMIDKTIQRLDTYLHMADFGTCALDWPLMDKWEDEVAAGKMPE